VERYGGQVDVVRNAGVIMLEPRPVVHAAAPFGDVKDEGVFPLAYTPEEMRN